MGQAFRLAGKSQARSRIGWALSGHGWTGCPCQSPKGTVKNVILGNAIGRVKRETHPSYFLLHKRRQLLIRVRNERADSSQPSRASHRKFAGRRSAEAADAEHWTFAGGGNDGGQTIPAQQS